MPAQRGYDGSWTCKHPTTGKFYASGQYAVTRFDPSANAWSWIYNGEVAGIDRGQAAIDGARNKLLRIGDWNSTHTVPITIDLATSQMTRAVLSGPFAASILGYYQASMVWDEGLGAFLYFQDDGYLYAITYVSDAEYRVDRMPLAGVPPTPGGSGVHSGGPCAIYGRMQYVPNLKGVVIVQRYDADAYFVRTA
jgi:hypothetical protein